MTTNYLDNYYARLGVARDANQDEIQTAYRRAARQLHPDQNQVPGANELFLLVQEAYDTLSNPRKRKAYNTTLPEDIDGPPALMINTLYSRSAINPGEGRQVLYVLLDMMAARARDQIPQRPPLNLTLVLDTSTSMAGGRLGQVVRAAGQFIEQLHPHDIISVVTFNDRAEVLLPASPHQDRKRLMTKLSMLHTSGGTEIYQGLEAGATEAQRHLRPSYVNHLVLITDGRTYGDEAECLELAGRMAEKGLSISAIGIGEAWNEEFIDALVGRAGGSSVYVDNSSEIHKLLQSQLGKLNQIFARNLRMEYKLGPDVDLRYAFRLTPDLGGVMSDSPLYLGAVPLSGSLSVLLEFEVTPGGGDGHKINLAEGRLQLDIPTRQIPSAHMRFALSRPLGDPPDGEAPLHSLITAIGKLSLYRMQEDARMELRSGNTEAAAKRMRMLSTHLLSAGERSLAKTVLMAAEDMQAGKELDEKSGKQIKYGTRALIHPDE
jgi:Ca-activated chloride channel family protein